MPPRLAQYKDYILTLLFVKYVSDKAKADPNSLIDVPKGGSFDDMLAAKGDKEIGDRINKIITALAAPGSAATSHLPPERVGVLGRGQLADHRPRNGGDDVSNWVVSWHRSGPRRHKLFPDGVCVSHSCDHCDQTPGGLTVKRRHSDPCDQSRRMAHEQVKPRLWGIPHQIKVVAAQRHNESLLPVALHISISAYS